MLTANQKLVMLMRKKQEQLNEWEIKTPKYSTKKDEKDILSWDIKEAREAWKLFKNNTKEGWAYGLCAESCPFCLRSEATDNYMRCSECSYGDRHGECGDDNSSYSNILSKIEDIDNAADLNEDNSVVLPGSFYKKIIKEIDKIEDFIE